MTARPRAILMVDDEPMVRNMFSHILAEAGYAVQTAAGAREALERLRAITPDLFLLDVDLGRGPNGIALCRCIRALPAFAHTPILMLTGETHREIVLDARAAGSDGYVLKGALEIPDFLARLRRLIDRAPAPPAPAAPEPEEPRVLPSAAAGIAERIDKLLEARALPFVVAELNKMLLSSGTTAEEAAAMVARDPALATKLLTLANSTFFRGAKRVTTLERAVVSIGFSNLRHLSMAMWAMETLGVATVGGLSPFDLWTHGLACAVLARELALRAAAEDPDQAFVAGLMHDLGRAVLAEAGADAYPQVLEAVARGVALPAAEGRLLGLDHRQAAKRLFVRWKIPDELIQPVEFHHDWWSKLRTRGAANLPVAAAVTAAEAILKTQALPAADDDRLDELPDELCATLQLSQDGVERVLEKMIEEVEELRGILYLHAGEGLSEAAMTPLPAPRERTRHALRVTADRPRVDLGTLVLRRLGYEVSVSAAPAAVAHAGADAVLGEVKKAEDLADWRALARGVAGKTRFLLYLPESLAAHAPELAADGIAAIVRPGRVSQIVAALTPPTP